jgi:hypothetical protein
MTAETTDFVAPAEPHPRERYAFSTEKVDNGPGISNSLRVTVREVDTDGNTVREAATYTRRYHSMYSTFEPFRQLRDGVWHDYALISADYTHLSVLDLATGEVVADEQPSADLVQKAREYMEEYPSERHANTDPADFARTWGFCPVEFFVPDPADHPHLRDTSTTPTGHFGVYSGCIWGDDSGWKLRYVDLSRISEGIVTTDERFGYVELPWRQKLREAVSYSTYTDRFDVAVQLAFKRETGGADPWARDLISWSDQEHD